MSTNHPTRTASLMVNADSGPVPVDVHLDAVDRRLSRNGEGWFARISTGAGTIEASRLDGETGWRVDARFSRTGLPFEVHGYGSRCCAKTRLAPEIEAWLDEATR